MASPEVTDPPGRVDVEMDVLLGVLGLQEQELRDHEIRDVVVDGAAEEDDAVAQQPRVDVEGALAALALLDHVRNQRHSSLPGRKTYPTPQAAVAAGSEPRSLGGKAR